MKKILAIVVVVALTAAIAIAGTLAWLTAETGPVTNVFTVGKVGATLTESPDLDLKLIPGNTIEKDPKVTIDADSEDCWLFVKVEEENELDSYIGYKMADGWTQLKDADDNDIPGVFYREAEAGEEFDILDGNKVTVLDDVTMEMTEELTEVSYPKLIFTGYVVQRANMDTALDAWTALIPNP